MPRTVNFNLLEADIVEIANCAENRGLSGFTTTDRLMYRDICDGAKEAFDYLLNELHENIKAGKHDELIFRCARNAKQQRERFYQP